MPRKKNPGPAYQHDQWLQQQARGEDRKQLIRQKARREYDKAGIDRSNKQIDHVKPLEDGGSGLRSNLKLISVKSNEAKNLHHPGEKAGKKRSKLI